MVWAIGKIMDDLGQKWFGLEHGPFFFLGGILTVGHADDVIILDKTNVHDHTTKSSLTMGLRTVRRRKVVCEADGEAMCFLFPENM